MSFLSLSPSLSLSLSLSPSFSLWREESQVAQARLPLRTAPRPGCLSFTLFPPLLVFEEKDKYSTVPSQLQYVQAYIRHNLPFSFVLILILCLGHACARYTAVIQMK